VIATYLQIVMSTIALFVCVWGYRQGIKMAAVSRRYHLNGSTGMTVRTIKRREVLQGLKCVVMILSGWYAASWLLHDGAALSAGGRVVVLRSASFTLIAFLIALNTIWDALDRWNAADMRLQERERLTLQKRATDPNRGATLPPDVIELIDPHGKDRADQ